MNKIIFKKKIDKSGFSLIEILFASLVVAMTLTAIAASLSYSINLNNQSNYRAIAIDKAQEGLDFFKRERVTLGWSEFQENLSNETGSSRIEEEYCVASIPSPSDLPDTIAFSFLVSGQCSDYDLDVQGAGVNFKRNVTVSLVPGDIDEEIVITVTVSWPSRLGSDPDYNTVELSQEFHRW